MLMHEGESGRVVSAAPWRRTHNYLAGGVVAAGVPASLGVER
jgi:hypothetical protein